MDPALMRRKQRGRTQAKGWGVGSNELFIGGGELTMLNSRNTRFTGALGQRTTDGFDAASQHVRRIDGRGKVDKAN
jgi:hypothetical protein